MAHDDLLTLRQCVAALGARVQELEYRQAIQQVIASYGRR